MTRWVFGLQPAREVLRSPGSQAKQLLVEPGDNPRRAGLAKLAADRGVPVVEVSRRELDRIAKGTMHQGVALEAPPLRVLDRDELLVALDAALEAGPPPTALLLDGVVDPHNFGAVLRSAVALGAPFVVWPEHGAAPLTPTTFRASAGAVEHARLARVRALPELITALRDRGFVVAVLDARGDTFLHELDLSGPVALVLGAEEKGARLGVRRAATALAKLPMPGPIDSLNASVAAAVALYEVVRQRLASG